MTSQRRLRPSQGGKFLPPVGDPRNNHITREYTASAKFGPRIERGGRVSYHVAVPARTDCNAEYAVASLLGGKCGYGRSSVTVEPMCHAPHFNLGQVISFFSMNPATLRRVVVSSAPPKLIAGLQLILANDTRESERKFASLFQTAGDYQTTRVLIPIMHGFRVDVRAKIHVVTHVFDEPTTYDVTLLFGAA
jgi:hypothetical protein